MELFRVFDWDGSALGRKAGGPLFVPRDRQGAGRHDAPTHYGAWYCSREAVAAVAESIKSLRGHVVTADDFRRTDNAALALVGVRLNDAAALVDLDDPKELVARGIRPSRVATRQRPVTQRIAAAIFEEGAAGLLWWSTLEADWINATLFHERALPHISIVMPPRPLTTAMPEVQQAAEHLGIRI